MDEHTYLLGRYKAYLRHGENAMIFPDNSKIIEYLNSGEHESKQWQILKANCEEDALRWHLPYTDQEKGGIRKIIDQIMED